MLGFLVIFAACLCGYAGAPVWSLPLAAAGLVSLSYAEHYLLYVRGTERGLFDEIEDTLVRSAVNALAATGGAFAFGVAARYFSGL